MVEGGEIVWVNSFWKPVHTFGEEIRNQLVELAWEKYEEFNHQHLTEMLGEQERVEVSRSSVRRILLVAVSVCGAWSGVCCLWSAFL